MIETLISTVGFPAAMCVWFMLRTEKVIQHNTAALEKINGTITKCQKK